MSHEERPMTVRGQLLVATTAAIGGLFALGVFCLLTRPDPGYRNIAIGTLIYATTYMLTVPRAEAWLLNRSDALLAIRKGD
jgi:hypothetical protein